MSVRKKSVVRTVEERLIPLVEEARAAGNRVFDLEKDIQALIAAAPQAAGTRAEVVPRAALTLGACAVIFGSATLSAAAVYASLTENERVFKADLARCAEQHSAELDAILSNIPQAERDVRLAEAWARFTGCTAATVEEYSGKTGFTLSTTLGGIATPVLTVAGGIIRITLQSFFAGLDVGTLSNIYFWGTRDKPNTQRNMPRQVDIVLTPDREDTPDMFFAQTGANGEAIVPVGNWNVVGFVPGFARFGTSTGQTMRIAEDDTTEITVNAVPISDITVEDLATCDTGGADTGDGNDDAADAGDTVIDFSQVTLADFRFCVEAMNLRTETGNVIQQTVCSGPSDIQGSVTGTVFTFPFDFPSFAQGFQVTGTLAGRVTADGREISTLEWTENVSDSAPEPGFDSLVLHAELNAARLPLVRHTTSEATYEVLGDATCTHIESIVRFVNPNRLPDPFGTPSELQEFFCDDFSFVRVMMRIPN